MDEIAAICSFCEDRESSFNLPETVDGQKRKICLGCMADGILFLQRKAERVQVQKMARVTDDLSSWKCNFCGKSGAEVNKLVSGPDVHICNECIGLCVDIMNDDRL